MEEIWKKSATYVAKAIQSGSISASDAALAALTRLQAVNPAINAVVDHRADEVIARARRLDSLPACQKRGLLFGVPITVKVNVDQVGFATTNGVTLQKEAFPTANNPVVDNLLAAGAIIIGRTNTPAFSYRWFTSNRLHGTTRNPRSSRITPGGSSGGAAAAVAAGIGHIGHGTDIAGSIRYPAYACGVHGLRPTPGHIPAYNSTQPERSIGGQITSVSGPIARTIGDLRLALLAMSARDPRDPWWVPAPIEGPPRNRIAAVCPSPGGLVAREPVRAAVLDAGQRLERAGWYVELLEDVPPLREAADLQTKLWLADGFQGSLAKAEQEGDPGALSVLRGHEKTASTLDLETFSNALRRRATLLREWLAFLERYAVLVTPVSAELPFPDELDLRDASSFSRVWEAQMLQLAIPFLGLPALSVATGMVGDVPSGVQVIASRYREDLCLLAGEAIESGGVPPAPIDPTL